MNGLNQQMITNIDSEWEPPDITMNFETEINGQKVRVVALEQDYRIKVFIEDVE